MARRHYPIARVAAVAALVVWAIQRREPRRALPVHSPSMGCPELVDIEADPGGMQRMGDGRLQPQPGQQRATGNPPKCRPEFATVVNGFCWLSLEQRPPVCPKGSVAYEGRCLVPLAEKARLPTSIQEKP